MVVVVTNDFNMASYFLEAGNLMCSDKAGPSISGSGDLSGCTPKSGPTSFGSRVNLPFIFCE